MLYSKIVDQDFIYYIQTDLLGKLSGNPKSIQITTISDFVIDRRTDEIVKNRSSSEIILDKYVGLF